MRVMWHIMNFTALTDGDNKKLIGQNIRFCYAKMPDNPTLSQFSWGHIWGHIQNL